MSNNIPIISIIVPIYNVENYIHYCLKSILNQTFSNYECLLIDDGSTDLSGTLCDNICYKDSRFKVIHQNNQGEAAARNQGLRHAIGKYIYFMDSDDYIHPQTLEFLYNAINRHQTSFSMILGKRVYNYDEPYSHLGLSYTLLSQDKLIKRLFGNSNEELQYQVLWNKLYPKELIKNIFLNKTASEDTDFNLRVFLQSQSAVLINAEMYYWVQRNSSITHSGINKRFVDILDTYYNIYNYIPNNKKEYKTYCIYKLYKRILNIRYHTQYTEYKQYAKNKIKTIIKDTWNDFWKNKSISFSQKIMISCLLHIPFLYRTFMWYCNHK